MEKLHRARAEISAIDRQMAELFEKRMHAVSEIEAYKRERGLPVQDAAREAALLRQNAAYIRDDTVRACYIRYMQSLFRISRAYQEALRKAADAPEAKA